MVKKKNDVQHVNGGGEPILHPPPFVSSYNDKIRPILDAVNNLRHLNVTQESISLPTIVVIGDQSSGKSSVLDSLSGINLPRRHGTCTRVPLVMRLRHHPDPEPEFLLRFRGKTVRVSNENRIPEAIDRATVEIAGDENGVSNVALTLEAKKRGFPDLNMVDLPGIIRVPVGNQPDDIYEQISGIIMERINPEDSIVLNVFSAYVPFTICESVCMSKRVDETGRRTLGVVTKCDLSPNGLLEKVTANKVGIGLGYICVRNRIDDESYDEARAREDGLFRTHPLLSKIDKSMVGIPSLARRLVEIQLMMISNRLLDFVKKIDERLDSLVLELNKLPPMVTMVPDAIAELIQTVGSLKETLQEILIRGEFDKYKDDKQMHFNARLVEMLDEFSKELHSSVEFSDNFLVEEIQVLEETKGIRVPHFVADSTFLFLLRKKVDRVSKLPVNFINKVWVYLETVCIRVFVDHCENYPQLLPSLKKAAHNVMAKTKAEFVERVVEMIEIEKTTYYTCDPNLNRSLKKLMGSRGSFVNKIERLWAVTRSSSEIHVDGYGAVDVKHLVSVAESLRDQAFDLKMRMTAYWEIVLNRMVDWIVLQLRFAIKRMVNTEMGTEIVNEVMVNDGCIEKMMAEPSSVAAKREGLRKNIRLLQESKKVIGKVIDVV